MPNPGIIRRLGGIGVSASSVVSAWVARVVANGGAAPSAGTISAATTFYAGLQAAGLDSVLTRINFFAPDSNIACLTPLICGTSAALYAPSVGGTVGYGANGWTVGVTDNSVITTSFSPLAAYPNPASCSLVLYISSGRSLLVASGYHWGVNNTNEMLFQSFWTGTTLEANGYMGDTFNIVSSSFTQNAYFCLSRTSKTRFYGYWANSITPHALWGTSTATVTNDLSLLSGQAFIGARSASGGINGRAPGITYSFIAAGYGMSAAQSSTLYNLVQALRTSLGGGFV